MTRRPIVAAAALFFATSAMGETLRDAIASTRATNPQFAAAQARQDALTETPEQARAAGRLTSELDASGGYSRFDYGEGGSGTVSAALPIWTGGRVGAAVRAASGDVSAGAQGVRDALAVVLEAAIGAYAELLYTQQAVAVATADIDLLDRQVAEARSRFALGLSTQTDVAQLEAQREAVVATLADAKEASAAAAATYHATVGHAPGALDADPAPPNGLPATLEAARQKAVEVNPLVLQQRFVARADAARIDGQRAERNPALGLSGAFGYAAGALRPGYTEAAVGGLTLRLPLLTGGLTASRIRQAEATYRADRYTVDAAEREAARSAETGWASLVAAQQRVQSGARQVQAAEAALRGVRAEYAFSLRTTLDILIADESLRAAQLALARSHSDVLFAQAVLLRAVGSLDVGSYDD